MAVPFMFFTLPGILVIGGLIVVGLIIALALVAARNQSAGRIIVACLAGLGLVIVLPFALRAATFTGVGRISFLGLTVGNVFLIGLAIGLIVLLVKGGRSGRLLSTVAVVGLAVLAIPVIALFQYKDVRAPIPQNRPAEAHIAPQVEPDSTPAAVTMQRADSAGQPYAAAPDQPQWPEVAGLADRYPTIDSALDAVANWVTRQLTDKATTGPPAANPIPIHVAGSAPPRAQQALIHAINQAGPRLRAAALPQDGPTNEASTEPDAPIPAQLVFDEPASPDTPTDQRIFTLKLARGDFQAATALMVFDLPWVLDPSKPFADGHVVGYSQDIRPEPQAVQTQAIHAAVSHLLEQYPQGTPSAADAGEHRDNPPRQVAGNIDQLADRIIQAEDWPVTVFTQTFDRPYGQVYRSAVLIEPTPRNMQTFARWVQPPATAVTAEGRGVSSTHRIKDLFSSSMFGRIAQGAVLVGVLVVVHAIFNAVTQAHRHRSGRAGMIMLAVLIAVGVAGLLLLLA